MNLAVGFIWLGSNLITAIFIFFFLPVSTAEDFPVLRRKSTR